MTISETIAATLNADTTLLTTLTGRAYAWDASGINGFSPQSTPNAYDSAGFLKPSALVHQRSENLWGGGHDSGARWDSLRAVVEIYLYVDGTGAYSTLETAKLRVMTLLHEKFISGAGRMRLMLPAYYDRDFNFNQALYIRMDFQAVYGRQL